jgi:hypothetical protein
MQIIPKWLIQGYHDLIDFLQRFSILHHPKIMLILLFIAAQFNPSILGLVYFIVALVFAPMPNVAARSWFFLAFYAQVVIFAQYIYQFPFFKAWFNCPNGDYCKWFHWAGVRVLGSSEVPEHYTSIGYLMWDSLLICFFSVYQKFCWNWKLKMEKEKKWTQTLFIPPTPVTDNTWKGVFKFFIYHFKRMVNMFGSKLGFEVCELFF